MTQDPQVKTPAQLRELLLDAFPPRPLPAGFRRFSDEWWGAGSAATFAAGFVGKSWDELAPDFLAAHPNSLQDLDDPAFGETLPAYLCYLLEREPHSEMLASVASTMTRTGDQSARWAFEAIYDQLEADQRAALKQVVRAMATTAPMQDLMTAAYDSYWHELPDAG